jgi:hypothetical protein
VNWLPEALHPVVMRLARADHLAYELGVVALAWSRGPDDQGALRLRQVERTPGFYDVEVASIRPVPPVAAMLFSEAVHHLRSAVDNVVFHMLEMEYGQPLTPQQKRNVSMLVHDEKGSYIDRVKRLTSGKNALPVLGPDHSLGKRIASLQPFNDDVDVPAIPPSLTVLSGGSETATTHPLSLLRDYSNEDKHRTIRLAAGRSLVQRPDDWERSVGLGMRTVEVGTVLERVEKGVPIGVEISPAIHVQRPDDGLWVSPGYELDAIARHVSDIVIPTLVTGLALPDALPADVDLSDTGEELAERLAGGGRTRAHDRMRAASMKAYFEAAEQRVKWPPITSELGNVEGE